MKKILILALVAMSAHTLWADDYNYLTVAYNSVEQSITLSTVQKITFEDSNCVVTTTEGNYSFPLSQMEKMTFTADPTAIEALPLQSENMKCLNGQLTLGQTGLLRIYNASGALIRVAQVSQKGTTVSLASLPSGLYIVTLGGQTIKVKK